MAFVYFLVPLLATPLAIFWAVNFAPWREKHRIEVRPPGSPADVLSRLAAEANRRGWRHEAVGEPGRQLQLTRPWSLWVGTAQVQAHVSVPSQGAVTLVVLVGSVKQVIGDGGVGRAMRELAEAVVTAGGTAPAPRAG